MTAWVGDSRAVAGVQQEGGGWRAEALSVDHSINDPAERARVLAAGANPNPNLNPNPNPHQARVVSQAKEAGVMNWRSTGSSAPLG